jgi:hypothetical protein
MLEFGILILSPDNVSIDEFSIYDKRGIDIVPKISVEGKSENDIMVSSFSKGENHGCKISQPRMVAGTPH